MDANKPPTSTSNELVKSLLEWLEHRPDVSEYIKAWYCSICEGDSSTGCLLSDLDRCPYEK